MTLILKLDHTKNKVSISRGSKVIAWTDRNKDRQTDRHTDTQTDRQTDMTKNITYLHTWVVKMTLRVTKGNSLWLEIFNDAAVLPSIEILSSPARSSTSNGDFNNSNWQWIMLKWLFEAIEIYHDMDLLTAKVKELSWLSLDEMKASWN